MTWHATTISDLGRFVADLGRLVVDTIPTIETCNKQVDDTILCSTLHEARNDAYILETTRNHDATFSITNSV